MINTTEENGPTTSSVGEASAQELAAAIGGLPIEDLHHYQPELAAAVAELASSAGRNWIDSHDDPVVALLRVLARLAIQAPTVTSSYAGQLLALGPAPTEALRHAQPTKSRNRRPERLSNALSAG